MGAVTEAGPAPMPAAFIGHGSPMNAVETNRFTEAWRAFGTSVPRPRAILVISAHWFINATAVTAMPRPRTIHDFFGFPRELFEVDYPAPGLPELAAEISDVVKPTWVGADVDSWGIDHGTWSVLVHAFPAADIPVVQLSLQADAPLDYHLELGARLAPLRDAGVLILGSGNIVHNLRALDFSRPDASYDWARRFDEAARDSLTGTDPTSFAALGGHPDYRDAVPTPDHFLPALYLAGLADTAGQRAEMFVGGCSYGSLSMACYAIGAGPRRADAGGSPAAGSPTEAPPEASNM